MASLLDLAGYVQKQGELGRQRGEQSRLASLASQAYTAPRADRQALLGQMAQTSPDAAVSQQKLFRQGDSDRMADLSRKAKIFVGMAESGNAQAVASLYPQIAQEARDLGLGDIPLEYNDTFLPGLKKFATILDGDQTSEVGVQSTYVDAQGNRVAIMRDGSTSVLGQNAPSNQIIDTGNGYFGVNKGNLSASPVIVGGQPQQAPQPSLQAGLYQTPTGMVRIGEDLTPEQQQAALADIQAGGTADNVQLPARNVAPPQFGGGQQLRSAPKTAEAPSGFRYGSDGQTLEPIPGGPSDPSAQGASLKDELAFRKDVDDVLKQDRSILAMYQNVESASRTPSAAGDLSMIFAFMKMLDPGSVVREQEFANAQNAAGVPDQIRNLYNRAASGQRLNENQRRDFLSQARALANQAQTRLTNATRSRQSIAEQSGLDPTRATGMADFRNVQSGVVGRETAGAGLSGPTVGTIEGGYRFRGGNPADPNSWEKL